MTINVLIYGAGEAGKQISTYCKKSNFYNLLGFIDDNHSLYGTFINGIKVYAPEDIQNLITNFDVTEIFVAIPSVRRERYHAILRKLNSYHIHLRTLPTIEEISDGRVNLDDIREIKIEDLLLRPPVEPIKELLINNIKDKVVMITGAGGSIGSELCRQIIKLMPKKIILLDHSEFNLFTITSELQLICQNNNLTEVPIVALLGSVSDETQIRAQIEEHIPDTLFHAAAYKHVSIVENNIAAGVKNNIFGTLYLAKASYEFGVKNFVLISTDKSVRPSSFMGATKRVSELILQAFASSQFQRERPHKTCFSMVRFGNVLGSSGSVVPIFKDQIKKGGPVTVTHPEVTRYFMTICEAAQLVIQASSLAKGGEIFLLDMGEPVKIYDLARNMIELTGMYIKDSDNVKGDIEIIFTGLGKGEKLYEETLISGVSLETIHPKIMIAKESYLDWGELKNALDEIGNSPINDTKILESLAPGNYKKDQ